MKQENWKPAKGFEGYYAISDLGRVKGLRRNKILKPYKTPRGYLTVTLNKSGERATIKIHRLVYLSFIGEPPQDRPDIHHKNYRRDCNHLDNLIAISKRENNSHSWLKRKSGGFIGITFHKHMKRWCARLWIGGRYKQLGYFQSEIDAYRAYVKALREHGIKNKYIDPLNSE